MRSVRTAAALGAQGRGGQEARAVRRLQATARALLATRSDMIRGSKGNNAAPPPPGRRGWGGPE